MGKVQSSITVQKFEKQGQPFPCQIAVLEEPQYNRLIYRQRYMGSGVLISKNIVLTAAHNIFKRNKGQELQDIKVYFEVDGIASEYCEVEGIRYYQEFTTCEQNKMLASDYALLKLKKQLPYTDFLQVSLGCFTCLMDKNKQTMIQIFGFPPEYKQNYQPLDKTNQHFKLTQFGYALSNAITAVDSSENKISYRISTLPGQNGCPVIIGKQIIGLHIGTEKEDETISIGRLIDKSMVETLQGWCKYLNGEPFLVNDNLCPHVFPIMYQESMNLVIVQDSNSQLPYNYEGKKKRQQYPKNLPKISKETEATIQQKAQRRKKLDLSSTLLKQINLSEYINLSELNLSNNNLYAIDLSNNDNLVSLFLQNNQLSSINVTNIRYLYELNLDNNLISAIDITKNTYMGRFSIKNNRLTKIISVFTLKKQQDRLLSNDYDFSHQSSAVCELQIKCSNAYKTKCHQRKEQWGNKYGDKQHNKYGCKYILTAIKR